MFPNAHTLLAQGNIYVILIATPHPLHVPTAVEAARRGVHVLSEKPLAVSVADADRVVACCRAHGVLLGVMFQQRTDPTWRTIKRMVDEGVLGQVYRLGL